jgi:hypothetical protein
MKPRPLLQPITDPLAPRALVELNLYSAFMFVFAALITQFLLTLITAGLLKLNAISFQYGLFTINFVSEISYNMFLARDLSQASSIWSEEQIYLIFITGPVILASAGLRLLFVLKKMIQADWRTKLALTWLAFVLVNTLPCGIVAGVFFYEGFGTAFHWMVGDYFVRAFAGLGVALLLVSLSRFWRRLFLNACYHQAFLEDEYNQRKFISQVFLKPWFYGLLVLLLFNRPPGNLYWPAFLLCLGVMPGVTQSLRYQTIFISRPDSRIFTSGMQIFWFLSALVILWIAGAFRFNL